MPTYKYTGTAGNDYKSGGNSGNYINGVGWVYDDSFFEGLAGNDELRIYNGNATIDGGLGNDKLYGGSNNDSLIGGDGNDYIEGGEGKNTLIGGNGNDTLSQGYNDGPADTMFGGSGDDFFEIRSATARIIEIGGQGVDTIRAYESFTLPSFVEVLDLDWAYQDVNGTGNAQDNTLNGNSKVNNLSGLGGDDSIYGNGGNDILNGGDGDDTLVAGYYYEGSTTLVGGNGDDILRGHEGGSDYMNGGAGDDVFYVDFDSNDISDTIIEQMNGGYDEVICAADTYQLADNIEILTMVESADVAYGNAGNNFITGTDYGNQITADEGNDTLYGLGGMDTINGGTGNDIIDGGSEADNMVGGQGDDVYYVDLVETYQRDKVVEISNGGNDKIVSSTSYTLDVNVERLQLIANARNGTGNNLSNTLDGNDLSNMLSGEAGADRLLGMGAADRLLGGGGADFLDGGAGNDILTGADISARGRNEIDTLTGGLGADRFILANARGRFYDDGNAKNAGRTDYVLITDFTVGQDKLQLDGAASGYYLAASGVTGVTGTGLYAEQGATDELIAIIRSANSTALNAANTVNTALFV
jgi:Ca2+-binding RTX toxin-like protein